MDSLEEVTQFKNLGGTIWWPVLV